MASTLDKEKLYTVDDFYALPNFIRAELFDGKLYTDDWTTLKIDDEVFKNPPSAECHVTYQLSVIQKMKNHEFQYSRFAEHLAEKKTGWNIWLSFHILL